MTFLPRCVLLFDIYTDVYIRDIYKVLSNQYILTNRFGRLVICCSPI